MVDDLARFIEAAKSQGASDTFLVQLLKDRGWPEREIYQAFTNHYEKVTGIIVPQRSAGTESAKDAFLYLVSFSTLAVWTTALVSLLFSLLNQWIPDNVIGGQSYGNRIQSISTQMASLIIGFPVYAWTLWTLGRELQHRPDKSYSPIRKWLTYLALFLAAGFVVGDLITFVSYFLRGELSQRFVLKVATILVVGSGVFWFYLTSLREQTRDSKS